MWQKEHGLCGCQTKFYSHTKLYECIQTQRNSTIIALVHTNTHLYKQFTKLYKQKWLPLKVARLNNASFLWYNHVLPLFDQYQSKAQRRVKEKSPRNFSCRICCSFSVPVTRRTKNSSRSFDRSVSFEDECII